MRRLAKDTRRDDYASNRDYQEIVKKRGTIIRARGRAVLRIEFRKRVADKEAEYFGFGGYVWAARDGEATLRIAASGATLGEKRFALKKGWNRVALAVANPGERVEISLSFDDKTLEVGIWGLNAETIELPEPAAKTNPTVEDMNSPYVAPETFYLDHDAPIALEIAETSTPLEIEPDEFDVETKKCSYCQRMLPLESKNLGSLAFHKHNAKKTKHQNECRSCKKWRINDTFNPRRSKDQLHESSTITRERAVLLRDPEILQAIKDRHGGAGLKSIVWNKFGRKCFKCGGPLKLSDVELDHTRPLAYLWPIDEHATCLCGTCNNLKKDKFPVDVYSDDELRRLSGVTGLALSELRKRDVNGKELDRIITNIEEFATAWSARTFNATARKVRERRSDIDLFEILRKANSKLHAKLLLELKERPDAKEVDEE